jgi:hypothetical protein
MVSSTLEVNAVNLKKMLRISVQLGLFVVFPSASVWAKNLPQESPSVTISVFNDAGISSEILKQAERVASQVFEESGIHVDWVNCAVPTEDRSDEITCPRVAFPDHLHLRIVRHSLNLKDSILGISYITDDGRGFQADVFYEGIERLQRDTFVCQPIILGHVMAHEIGHLLLGINSHSPWGIMRAHWNQGELALANKCMLLFTEPQSHRMTERLRTRTAEGKCPSANVTELSATN